MTPEKPVCQIIGAGRAGRAVSRAMHRAGYRFSWVGSRERADAARLAAEIDSPAYGAGFDAFSSPVGLIIFAVPDGVTETVAVKASEALDVIPHETIALHLSGSLDSGALAALRDRSAWTAAFHPCQTFSPDSDPGAVFTGILFDMEGDDAACEAGERIAADLQADTIRLTREQRLLTHLAMTIASNLTVSVLRAAFDVLENGGIGGKKASLFLEPLVRTTVDNVFTLGVDKALTGPVSRGDTEVVARHLEALKPMGRDIEEAYRVLSRIALEIALSRGDLTPKEAERLMESGLFR